MVDLDLDVIRRRHGIVELLHEDEFEAHQVELDYPTAIVDHARDAAEHVLSAVRVGAEPFNGTAAQEWLHRRER